MEKGGNAGASFFKVGIDPAMKKVYSPRNNKASNRGRGIDMNLQELVVQGSKLVNELAESINTPGDRAEGGGGRLVVGGTRLRFDGRGPMEPTADSGGAVWLGEGRGQRPGLGWGKKRASAWGTDEGQQETATPGGCRFGLCFSPPQEVRR